MGRVQKQAVSGLYYIWLVCLVVLHFRVCMFMYPKKSQTTHHKKCCFERCYPMPSRWSNWTELGMLNIISKFQIKCFCIDFGIQFFCGDYDALYWIVFRRSCLHMTCVPPASDEKPTFSCLGTEVLIRVQGPVGTLQANLVQMSPWHSFGASDAITEHAAEASAIFL